MQCHHFDAGRCQSCVIIRQPYASQVADKQAHCADLISPTTWLPPVRSQESGFRNKAKMVVTGTAEQPILGILDSSGQGIDLTDCGLYPTSLQATFAALGKFITRANLVPYSIAERRGELKYVLVTQSPTEELLIRFVLRSTESLARIRKHLSTLLAELPQVRVASANIHPAHQALVEGPTEILLTQEQTLAMPINDVTLYVRPQSFFQTNTEVAAALYRQGREWVDEWAPASVWDLYCGVGGFALHCAAKGRKVVGIETSIEAVASATQGAEQAGLSDASFVAADATAFALAQTPSAHPDVVIVNPPRRGIGTKLSTWLEESAVQTVIYSSCNADTLAIDLAAMPSLRPIRARVLDMFPQSRHYEVITLLQRI